MYGSYVLGQMSLNIQYFASARVAAHKIYSIIDQVNRAIEHVIGCIYTKTHTCDSTQK